MLFSSHANGCSKPALLAEFASLKVLRLRLFRSSDIDRILQIEEASFSLEAYSERTFLEMAHWFPDLFVVAETDMKIVGYMIACSLRGKGYVVSVAVDPCYRRRGVGSTLADHVLAELKARGMKMVELEVRVTNEEGIGFWKHLGFLPLRVIREYYGDGKDALKMRKTLK